MDCNFSKISSVIRNSERRCVKPKMKDVFGSNSTCKCEKVKKVKADVKRNKKKK